MGDWKADLDALVAETRAFTIAVNDWAAQPHPPPRETVQGLDPIDWGGPEREEIRKRVENFKAHQQRLAREREGYATSVLRSLRSRTESN
jgi:hypothetical protein